MMHWPSTRLNVSSAVHAIYHHTSTGTRSNPPKAALCFHVYLPVYVVYGWDTNESEKRKKLDSDGVRGVLLLRLTFLLVFVESFKVFFGGISGNWAC